MEGVKGVDRGASDSQILVEVNRYRLLAAKTAAKACSFAGATVVLMADGSRKPIEDSKVGDKVIATDPETGEQVAKTVTHLWVHDDTVVDLVVDGEVITTTEDHPFWSVTDQRFERADELSPGEKVVGADGRVITVSGLQLGTAREALAYNLSVQGIHTYHVGQNEILVHNTCPNIPGNPFRGPHAPKDAYAHLKKQHGLDPAVASNRLHVIKKGAVSEPRTTSSSGGQVTFTMLGLAICSTH